MSGPGAQYAPFSKLNDIVVVAEPKEGYENHKHEYERAVRLAGLRAAAFIGEIGRNVTPDEVKTYETYGVKEGLEKLPGLPRVGYLPMLQPPGRLPDTYD